MSAPALCPGYGMAEAAVAVAIDPTTTAWSSVHVDSESLAEREWRPVAEGGTELVTCGPPVLGTGLHIAGNRPLGGAGNTRPVATAPLRARHGVPAR